MRSGIVRIALFLAIAALVALSANTLRLLERQRRVGAVQEAAAAGRWQETLDASEDLVGDDAEGQLAARARCSALVAMNRPDDCLVLVLRVIGTSDVRAWVPEGRVLKAAIRSAMARGDAEGAARVARFGLETHPEDLRFVELVLESRVALEGEEAVLAEYEDALDTDESSGSPEASGPSGASYRMRVLLAAYRNRRGDYAAALRVLGEEWPPGDHPMFQYWVQNRERAQAQLGDFAGFDETFRRWKETRGDSLEIDAYYALRLSVAGLPHPTLDWTELIEDVLAREQELANPELQAKLYRRLIAHLSVAGRYEEALAAFDRGAVQVEIPSITRGEIERALALAPALGHETATESPGTGRIRFSVRDARPGDSLLVSDFAGDEPDAPFRRHTLDETGSAELDRGASPWPERWVLRDREGHTRASGSFWPRVGERVEVPVARGEARPAETFAAGRKAPGDGHRGVYVLVLDCGDWRIAQYLRTRGELPFLDHLLRHGSRAVLTSDPPFTAMAMESLVWPNRGVDISFVGLVHRMGMELAGLESVGVNPFDFLLGVLPKRPNLFEVVGAGDRVAANMLFSHGNISAGHHAEVVGPNGARSRLEAGALFRPLRAEEVDALPFLREDEHARRYVESIAGEFDAGVELVARGELDLLLLRIEALDILTHKLVHELLEPAQDDGRPSLLAVYRYIDRRLAGLYETLDADDVLVVMSDHGIRTTTRHESDAMFVVTGPGIPTARAAGRPDLVGVPSALASLLGVESPGWPSRGLELSSPSFARATSR